MSVIDVKSSTWVSLRDDGIAARSVGQSFKQRTPDLGRGRVLSLHLVLVDVLQNVGRVHDDADCPNDGHRDEDD